MNCEEIGKLLKMVAPAEKECKTKSELRLLAERKQSGISGARVTDCLERLRNTGIAKKEKKCVQWAECWYDPLRTSTSTHYWWLFALQIITCFLEGFIDESAQNLVYSNDIGKARVPQASSILEKKKEGEGFVWDYQTPYKWKVVGSVEPSRID